MPAVVVPVREWVRGPVREPVRAEEAEELVWARALEPGRAEEPVPAREPARAPGAEAVAVTALVSARAWAAAAGAELAGWARTAPGSSRSARSTPGHHRGRTLRSSR